MLRAKRIIMRNSILVVLVLLLNACGGEAFSAEFDAVGGDVGGDAGATDVTAAGGSATAGTSSTGGTAAGSSAGGSATTAGAATAGAPVGGSPSNACEFDAAALTAALPTMLTWNSLELAKDGMCATCAFDPCGQLEVTWDKPVVKGNVVTYQVSYAAGRAVPMTVRVAGSNSCSTASYGMCDMSLTTAPISVTVTRQGNGWVISKAAVTVWFADSDCVSAIGKPGALVEQLNIDLQGEIEPLLINLKIPCN